MIELGPDPHRILGAHEAEGGVVVRTYRPDARAVRIQPAGRYLHTLAGGMFNGVHASRFGFKPSFRPDSGDVTQ